MTNNSLSKEATSIASRQRQAFNLIARGHSVQTVARMMGLTSKTIREYVEKKRHEIQGTAEQIQREDYVGLILSRREAIRSEAYANYSSCTKTGDRVKLLRLIMDNDTGELKDLQSLGLVVKESEKKVVSHEVSGTIDLKDVNQNKLDALAAMILSEKMGVTPEEAVNMCGRRGMNRLDSPVLDVGEPLQLPDAVLSNSPSDGKKMPRVYPVKEKAS